MAVPHLGVQRGDYIRGAALLTKEQADEAEEPGVTAELAGTDETEAVASPAKAG